MLGCSHVNAYVIYVVVIAAAAAASSVLVLIVVVMQGGKINITFFFSGKCATRCSNYFNYVAYDI